MKNRPASSIRSLQSRYASSVTHLSQRTAKGGHAADMFSSEPANISRWLGRASLKPPVWRSLPASSISTSTTRPLQLDVLGNLCSIHLSYGAVRLFASVYMLRLVF